eukprot:7993766-Alexandrium_andersonii.AAC.1
MQLQGRLLVPLQSGCSCNCECTAGPGRRSVTRTLATKKPYLPKCCLTQGFADPVLGRVGLVQIGPRQGGSRHVARLNLGLGLR